MNSTEWLVCRAFIDKKSQETKETLLSFLSPEQKKEFFSLYDPVYDISLGFDLIKHLLQWCHYSWLAPFIRTLSENEIPLFLSALPKKSAQSLSECLLFSSPPVSLSPAAKAFIEKKLAEVLLMDKPNLIPIEALPASSLNCLLKLTPEEMSLLIDFLGIHDLASEMRLIIDKVKIKKIESALSKEKKAFLTLLTGRQEPALFKPLELNGWNGKSEDLLTLLHKRGMNRLAKALYPENPNLIYYVKLRMSTDQASIFSSLCKKLENTKGYKTLIGQIMDILAFFKKHNLQASS